MTSEDRRLVGWEFSTMFPDLAQGAGQGKVCFECDMQISSLFLKIQLRHTEHSMTLSTKTSLLMLFSEIIAVHCESDTKYTYTAYGRWWS